MSAVMTTADRDAAEMRGIDQRARQEANKKQELQGLFRGAMAGVVPALPFVSHLDGPSARIVYRPAKAAVMEYLTNYEELVMVLLREDDEKLLGELKDKMVDAYVGGQYLEQVMVERGEL